MPSRSYRGLASTKTSGEVTYLCKAGLDTQPDLATAFGTKADRGIGGRARPPKQRRLIAEAGLKATPLNPRSGSTRGFHCPLHWQNLGGLGGLEVG